MSKRLERRLRLCRLFWRMKYFWAWLATCVGVRLCTNWREMPLQSPWSSRGAGVRGSAYARRAGRCAVGGLEGGDITRQPGPEWVA